MVNPKTPQECFDELQDVLMAIPEEKIVYTTMPYEEAMHEGQRVAALVTKYRDRLIRSDIDPVHLDTIFERAGAVAYCVAVLESYVKISTNNVKIYREKKEEGYKIRKELFEALEYVFRLDKTTLNLIKNIRKGAGDLDMIKDLNSIHLLCTNNLERLGKAHVEQSLIDRSLQLYTELSQLTAKIEIDPERIDKAKKMCNRAWTYLWEAMQEIYAAGRFVFTREPEIQELFFIEYYQKLGKSRNKNSGNLGEKETAPSETSTLP